MKLCIIVCLITMIPIVVLAEMDLEKINHKNSDEFIEYVIKYYQEQNYSVQGPLSISKDDISHINIYQYGNIPRFNMTNIYLPFGKQYIQKYDWIFIFSRNNQFVILGPIPHKDNNDVY